MFSKFNEEAKKVLVNMQKEMLSLKHPYIGSEHLLLSILKYGKKEDIKNLIDRGITYKTFKDELIKIVGIGKVESEFYLYTPLLRNIIELATLNANDKNKDSVEISDLVGAIFEEGEGIAVRIILGMDISIDNLYDDVNFANKSKNNNKFLIDTYGVDLNAKAKNNELDPVVGRDLEIKRLLEILSRRTKNNPLLIGDAGVGKTAIVEELARLIVNDNVSVQLKNKRIVSVSMASLVAGTKYRGEFEERIGKIIKELENSDEIILFIDEIHTLVGAGGAEGAIDASNILKPALARGKIKIIGATTTAEYKEVIEKDKALDRRFQTLEIKEPDLKIVKDILLKLKPIYENYHKVKISDEIIDYMIYLSNKFIYDRKMPDKAIDILDEVSSKVAISKMNKNEKIDVINEKIIKLKEKKNNSIIKNNFKEAFNYRKEELQLESIKNKMEIKSISKDIFKTVTKKDVREVIESKSRIPVFENGKDLILKTFKNKLNDIIIGQENAIEELYKNTKKIRFGIKESVKPFSYLFAGSTGVGKTLLAKEFTKLCYGEDNLIRLDMSEFKEDHSISKIIGSPPGYVGYDDNNNVLEQVKDKPYSVILLDELEKASPNVINLFLQILDEGKIKNSKGEIIRFDNAIIIMTTNRGYNKNILGFNKETLNREKDLKSFLGIEFLNRINKIIYFNNLTENNISLIIYSRLNQMKKRYKDEGIKINVSKKIINSLIDLTKYEEYGARKIDKVLEDYLESTILDQIVEGNKNIIINDINKEVV